MVFQKVVVIDARDHMLGRLASVVSKELLSGQAVVVVRCEQVCVSGSMIRNEMKWARFLRKRTAPNPKCGPFHHVAPSRILFRTIRGMVPHKTNRGATAMAHLKCFDGIPAPYDTMKKMVVPVALRVNRLRRAQLHRSRGVVPQERLEVQRARQAIGSDPYREICRILCCQESGHRKGWRCQEKRSVCCC